MSPNSPQQMEYHPTTDIPDNHWAVKCPDELIIYRDNNTLVKVNPTDERCYRVIVQFIDPNDMKGTLNRKYTEKEMSDVFAMAIRVAQVYIKHELSPQLVFAGNNSMEVVDGKVVTGRKEPSMLHVHVLGRGIPGKSYFGITCCGPPIGEEFNLKGQGSGEGMKKVPWKVEDMELFKEQLRKELS